MVALQIHNKRYLGVMLDADEVVAAATAAAQTAGAGGMGVRLPPMSLQGELQARYGRVLWPTAPAVAILAVAIDVDTFPYPSLP